MKTTPLLFTFLFSFFGFVNVLLAQELAPYQIEEIENSYHGNINFWKAAHWNSRDTTTTPRKLLSKAIETFRLEKKWQAYIEANTALVKTYHYTPEYQTGIKIGELAFEKIKVLAPAFRKSCGNLVYNIGLTFPYPYHDKQAIEKFSYAKNLVKNHPQSDTVLLAKIYNSMGEAFLNFNDFKNTTYHLFKAKELLEAHPFYEDCEYGYEGMGSDPGMAIINVTYDENGDTLSIAAVSADPPSILIKPICGNYLQTLGQTYTNIGNLYRLQGKWEQALDYLQQGLEKSLRAYVDRSELQLLELAKQYRALGAYYFEVHEYEQSSYYYKKTIQLIKASKTKKQYFSHLSIAESYYWISKNQINIVIQSLNGTEYDPSDFSKSTQYLEQALYPIFTKSEIALYLPEIPPAYTFYASMLESEVFELKVNIFLSAAEFFMVEEDDELPIEILTFLDTIILQGELFEDFENFDDKTKIHYYQVKAAYFEQSKQFPKAISFFKKNLNLIPLTETGSDRAYTNFKLAEIYQTLQNQDSSLFYNQQALISICKNFNQTNYLELPEFDDFKNNVLVQKILLQKAQLIDALSDQGKDLKTRKELLLQALSVIDLADKYQEQQLKKYNFLNTARGKGFTHESVQMYHKGIALAYKFHKIDYSDESLERAFYYIQKMKAQQLLVATAENEATELVDIDEDFLKKERNLKASISENELRIFNIEQEKDSILIEDIWRETERIFDSNRELEKLIKKMESEHPEYLENKYSFVVDTYADIQNVMEEEAIIIEYVSQFPDIFIFTIQKNQPLQAIKLPYPKDFYDNILQLRFLVSNSPMLRKSSRKKFIELSHLLYQQYISPIENQLKDKKRLIIIGTDVINYIPFELLLQSDKIKKFKKLDYLIKKFEVSYHYSTSLFAKAKRKTYRGEPSIYAFAPVYDDGNSAIASLEVSNIEDILNSNFRALDEKGNFMPLPISELEVKKIMELFDEKSPSPLNKLALRKNAAEDSLKLNLEAPYQFIHIAGHSFANAIYPKYSGIACYKNDKWNDNILFTDEIYNLRAKADLVTLSSCESGVGKITETEGVLGLNRAFIYAGAPNVVYSLWKVYDKANAVLMVDFYNNILTGKNYSKSLREAKLKLLKKEATASPHFWSPYLLIGR